MARPYTLTKLQLGMQVTGINLAKDIDKAVIDLIKKDVSDHRLLVFRQQAAVTPERHIQIGRWFGEVSATLASPSHRPLPWQLLNLYFLSD